MALAYSGFYFYLFLLERETDLSHPLVLYSIAHNSWAGPGQSQSSQHPGSPCGVSGEQQQEAGIGSQDSNPEIPIWDVASQLLGQIPSPISLFLDCK